MKLRYFGYLIREDSSQEKVLFNIKSIIDSFCTYENTSLKNSFKKLGSNLYLTKIEDYNNLYYFIKTNTSELIKNINTNNFSVDDIESKLKQDESLGFASYVYLCPKRSIIGIANSNISPRSDVFAEYVNNLFAKLDRAKYTIEMKALCQSAKKKDLLEMEFVNSAYIDIDANKGLGKLICNQIFSSEQKGLGKLKIKIEGTSNIKEAFQGIVNKYTDDKGCYVNDEGVNNIGAKAKEHELQGQLMDFYLDNENILSDNLNPRAKRKSLSEQIDDKVTSNSKIEKLYQRYLSQNKHEKSQISDLIEFREVKKFIISMSSANSGTIHEITEAEKNAS